MAAQVYEAKGGGYENQEGSKNEPKKGAPEPKDKAKKAAGKKTGQVCVSDRSWFRNRSLQPLKELGGLQAQAHERRLRARGMLLVRKPATCLLWPLSLSVSLNMQSKLPWQPQEGWAVRQKMPGSKPEGREQIFALMRWLLPGLVLQPYNVTAVKQLDELLEAAAGRLGSELRMVWCRVLLRRRTM